MNVLLMAFALIAAVDASAQSMYRGNVAHTGVYGSDGPKQFRRVKWAFPTGDRIVSSPALSEGVI